MRNLKKFLALVLAMVMAFSLMLSASAANFDDKHFSDTEEVTQAFKEAVAVLTGLNVIKGDGDGEIKDIRPQDTITRAEAAALVYRIATGDINDTQKDLYKDYGHFNDVNSEDWFAGYVGYCQNAGYIKGTTPTTFNPYGKVTGYEVLAMILRVVGYGKNNEFTGSSWQVEVASLGKTKHITDSVSSDQYGYTLNQPARREIVAELLFRGSLIPTVTWSSALGYNEFQSIISVEGNRSYNRNLAWKVFGLYRYGWRYGDDFGRPELVWKASLNPTKDREVAVLAADYTEAFHETKRECDVAELMNFGTAAYKDYVLFVNNDEPVTTSYHVVATDTVTKVGGMGRQVEIYTEKAMNEQYPFHDWYSYWSTTDGKNVGTTAPKDTIVMVDTIVAKVLNKTDAVLDAAGHVITPAKLTVSLYDDAVNAPTRRTIQKPATSKDNWEFAIGDVLCMNGISDTQGTANTTTGVVSGDESHAFRTNVLTKWNGTKEKSALVEGTDVFEITKMTGTSGKQTLIYKNVDKHQVDGTDKDDDLTLKLDKAGDNVNTTYIWYYDQYGYVQAIDEGSASFGVITSVYAAFGQGETQTNGTAKAVATVKFSDGTTGTVEIDRFLLKGATPETAGVATTAMKDLLVDTAGKGATTMELWPVYDTTTADPMKTAALPAGINIAKINSNVNGFVYMAPAAVSNINGHNTQTTTDKHGILFDNLFKFVKTANDQMVAVEVAGNGDNTGLFAGNFGAYTDNVAANGRLIKNLSMVSGKDDSTDPKVWIDNETKILVRDLATNSIAFYDGVSALPGDVKIEQSAASGAANVANAATKTHYDNEIDWADTDGDGRAEVLYITGKIDGQTTYGLFFYNGGAASWDGTKGTLEGFLNGEQKTLTFTNYADYNSIVTSSTAYKGHLFAVQQIQGVVTNVMEKNEAMGSTAAISNTNLWTNRLLAEEVTSATPHTWNSGKSGYATTADLTNVYLTDGSATTHLVAATDKFQLGGTPATAMNGNPYTTDTRAVYYKDTNNVNTSDYQVRWVPEVIGTTGTIEVYKDDGDGTMNYAVGGADHAATYYVNPGTKVWGLGHGVVSGESALEYLNKAWINDVTIVYNTTTGSNFAALEVYVSTDPDITDTPGDDVATVSGESLRTNTYSAADLQGYLMAGLRDIVVYNSKVTTHGQGTSAVGAGELPEETLYFPFVGPAGTPTVTFTIWDSSSNPVFIETVASVPAGAHYFNVNIKKPANNQAGGAWNPKALGAGTYTFTIETASAVLSSGTFTLG